MTGVIVQGQKMPLPARRNLATLIRRRNWIILPILSLLTIGVLAGSLEFIARRVLYRFGSSRPCLVLNKSTGIHGVPNSVCWEKTSEGPLVEYRFNACGHRSTVPCGPKPTGALRIVLIGSSFVMGYGVPYEQTFALRLQEDLRALTGRRLEVDNHGLEWGAPHNVDSRFGEALAAEPDLILWAVTPFDVKSVFTSLTNPAGFDEPRSLSRRGPATHFQGSIGKTMLDGLTRAPEHVTRSSSAMLLRHLLYESQSQYMRSCLMNTDNWGFLLKPEPPRWTERWQAFAAYIADMADRARGVGVPFVVTALPERAEALLISSGTSPPNLDPFAFGGKLRSLVENHSGVYLDLLSGFRHVPGAERLYYPVDDHLDGQGHAVVAGLLAAQLKGVILPALNKRQIGAGRMTHGGNGSDESSLTGMK